jgi:hypothetical protein
MTQILPNLYRYASKVNAVIFDIKVFHLTALKAFKWLEGFKLRKTHLKGFRANTAVICYNSYLPTHREVQELLEEA